MMNDMMPKEQSDFIEKIENYILETTNYGWERASELGFEIWQNKEWLKKLFIEDCDRCETDQWDALYKAEMKGRTDGIDAFFKALNRDNLIRNENDLIIASMLAEQLKEQK